MAARLGREPTGTGGGELPISRSFTAFPGRGLVGSGGISSSSSLYPGLGRLGRPPGTGGVPLLALSTILIGSEGFGNLGFSSSTLVVVRLGSGGKLSLSKSGASTLLREVADIVDAMLSTLGLLISEPLPMLLAVDVLRKSFWPLGLRGGSVGVLSPLTSTVGLRVGSGGLSPETEPLRLVVERRGGSIGFSGAPSPTSDKPGDGRRVGSMGFSWPLLCVSSPNSDAGAEGEGVPFARLVGSGGGGRRFADGAEAFAGLPFRVASLGALTATWLRFRAAMRAWIDIGAGWSAILSRSTTFPHLPNIERFKGESL
jgi:hypothetical protein